jgi:L-ascorbate metabolism protein UlaG (beta-lactamase superfamily)
MSRSAGRGRMGRALSLFSLMIVAAIVWAAITSAAETLCEPGFVRRPTAGPQVVPVVFHAPIASANVVTIQWMGHSSFLIVTPRGAAVLTDPHSWHPSPVTPDAVTISNEHPTHNQARSVPGNPRVLRGRTPEGEWIEVNVTINDLTIKSLPSSGGNSLEVPARNTIFVFRAEGLCLVHLGNLRQPLGEEQRRRIGRPDVLMVPIDGHWTLTYDQVATTIAQLRPSIVLPMHYDLPEHARVFMEFIKATVPVKTQAESTLNLTRGTLPAATEVIILGYRGG